MTAGRIRLAVGTLFVILLSAAWSRTRGIPGMAPSILVKWHQDDKFYYLESTGIPTHKMMVGITEWQQQVPLPQDFTGDNAFKIPRHPVFADKPVSAKTALFSGGIAVAVNGTPFSIRSRMTAARIRTLPVSWMCLAGTAAAPTIITITWRRFTWWMWWGSRIRLAMRSMAFRCTVSPSRTGHPR